MTKLIYFGCLSTTKYKDTCENAKKIIKLLDNEYIVIQEVPCCGSLLFHTSNNDELIEYSQSVYHWLKTNNVSDIITICAGCYNYFINEYPKYIPEFIINVKHLVQFISEKQNLNKLNLSYPGKKLVISYHDPCHLKNSNPEILDEPRNILNSIQGNIIFKELEVNKKSSICCGSGGGVYSSFKENAYTNTRVIFAQARKARAGLLLTPCPLCYTALKKAQEENEKIHLAVMKFEDFITKLIEGVEQIA